MALYKQEYATDRFYFDEVPFETLMQKRIAEVLLVCSSYDRFLLEEDGHIDEQLFHEYVDLGLSRPPHINQRVGMAHGSHGTFPENQRQQPQINHGFHG